MGRGNTCVFGDYEGLFYIDNDNFSELELDEDEEPILDKYGYPMNDYDLERIQWENDLDYFKSLFMKKYKTFSECDIWVDGECHAVLESDLFYVAVEDNEWSVAVKLLQKDDDYRGYSLKGLQAGLYQKYLNGIRDCLFNLYPKLGIYGGAWTSGTIKRPDKFKYSN